MEAPLHVLALAWLLALLAGCTYNTSDQAALQALGGRMTAMEQRQDATDARLNLQGEQIQRLNQRR